VLQNDAKYYRFRNNIAITAVVAAVKTTVNETGCCAKICHETGQQRSVPKMREI